jgi:hypothetical protein
MKRSATVKIVGFDALRAIVELSPTDCLLLADALAEARWQAAAPTSDYVEALRAALEACAVIAATDTLRDNNVSEAGMMDDTRRVWSALDTHDTLRVGRMVKRPD